MEELDYIVVGFGLAGLHFTSELEKNNKSFVVFNDNSQTSSLVAGGTYNPLVIKRYTPVWNGESQLELAASHYKDLETRFGTIFDISLLTNKFFSSVSDSNNWSIASDKPIISNYLNPKLFTDKINGLIQAPYGYGIYSGTGWINIKKLILCYTSSLKEKKCFLNNNFNYQNLIINNDFVQYENYRAKYIVFAEGYGLTKNPFFRDLPLQGLKGEVLTIFSENLKIDFQLKSSIFILPLGDHFYKVGSTFNRDYKTPNITSEAKFEIEEKLKKIIDVPYNVVSQSAGIRPTVKDRRPLVGRHYIHRNITVLNGLGTRGVMIAPTIAKALFNHLEYATELDKDINILRFKNSF